MTPNEVLELNFEQYHAVMKGYQQKRVDEIQQAVTIGYYSAYYNNSKRPKSPKTLMDKIRRTLLRETTHKATIDTDEMNTRIAKFQEMEEKFKTAGGGKRGRK